MKNLSVLIVFSVICGYLQSQTVNFDFPHFAGQKYVVYLLKGDKQDTVYYGSLDKYGKSTFVLPLTHKDFVGIARWSLPDGGGLEIVLNKEKNFIIHCTEAHPNDDNIVYINTPENEFMYGQYLQQANVINKAIACQSVLQQYRAQDAVYRFIDVEKQRLEEQFAEIQTGIRQSPLYAARIREFSDYLTHTGSRLNLTEKEIEMECRNFVLTKMDFVQLYYSGFWNDIINRYIASVSGNDSLLVADSRKMLARTSNKLIKEELLHKLILLYNKYGKENLLENLGVEDLVSRGRPAPMLTLTNKHIRPVSSLIIFYESGCNNCENALIQLRGNYPMLKEKGVEVISIAADRDEDTFRRNADLFPWADKYCDFKGFDGENFKNYGIVGTPTIFVVDKEGVIIGKYFVFLPSFLE
ncbi:hypothetical protein AGMMS50239_34060 [Bacteroidia bacterium]|nr:hypothetical protein AGMMS50239_34060 [Bacteroidia bacterium]